MRLLASDFANFYNQEADFSKLPEEGKTSLDWWKSINCSGVFKQVAIRISNLESSSANVDRTFSDIKQAQCPNRTNHSIETLRDLMIVKLSIRQGYEHDSDEENEGLQQTPVPSCKRRIPPKNLSTQVSILSDDSQGADLQFSSQISNTSTLTVFSQGFQEEELINLGPDIVAAYKEFKKLFDFRIVNQFRIRNDQAASDVDNGADALAEFRNLLQQE